MRKSKQEAAATRQRIIMAAAAAFRKNGIAGTGLSDLMAAAGLTHGGFYRHFDSKDQIVAEACTAAGESLVEQLAASASEKAPQRGFNTIVESYLSAAHRDEPADGCPVAALGSEMARGDERTTRRGNAGFSEVRTDHRLAIRQNSARCRKATSIGRSGHDDRGANDVPYRDGF